MSDEPEVAKLFRLAEAALKPLGGEDRADVMAALALAAATLIARTRGDEGDELLAEYIRTVDNAFDMMRDITDRLTVADA